MEMRKQGLLTLGCRARKVDMPLPYDYFLITLVLPSVAAVAMRFASFQVLGTRVMTGNSCLKKEQTLLGALITKNTPLSAVQLLLRSRSR